METPKIAKPPAPDFLYWIILEGLAQMYVRDDLTFDGDVKDELLNGIYLLRKHISI